LLRPRLIFRELAMLGFCKIYLKSLGLNFTNHSLLKSLLSKKAPTSTQNFRRQMLKKHRPLSMKLAPQQNAIKTIAIIAITVKANSSGVFMGENEPSSIRAMLTATVSWQLSLKALTFIFCPL
jgi:hypothetical protein